MDDATSSRDKTLETAANQLFAMGAERVNDDLGFEAVHRMYDRAIEIAEREETP